MKPIPLAIKEKLINRFKAESTNSQLNLRIVATQTRINTLLSEPIHQEISPSYGDVTLRQMAGEKQLSLAYAICLDHGIATIYKRDFPAMFEAPWEKQWSLEGSSSDVAIEYNGQWKMDASNQWYFLETEQFPYIFFVVDGHLYVQQWRESDSRQLLASGVSQISACKGWQNRFDVDLDQGLLIGYLKAGKVYYRGLCTQDDGSLVWENEREVSLLGNGNSTLSVIRTNDFRVGFVTENSGQIKIAITHRNYAGMSVPPESVHLNANAKMWISQIQEIKDNQHREFASIYIEKPYFLCTNPTIQGLRVIHAEKINRDIDFMSFGFKLTLSHPITGVINQHFLSKCSVSLPGVTITHIDVDTSQQILRLYTSSDFHRNMDVTVSTPQSRWITYEHEHHQRWFMPALSASVEAETKDVNSFFEESLMSSVLSASMSVQRAVYTDLCHQESTSVQVLNANMELVPVSLLPI